MSEQDAAPTALSDEALDAAIEAQKGTVAAFEQEFVPMRRRYERLRGRLRELDGERERRRLAASGQEKTFKPVPRRSITVADAVAGRERNVVMDAPLDRYTFVSMRRQPIVLHPGGDRAAQRLTFYRKPTPGAIGAAGVDGGAAHQTAEATTFAAAKRLYDEGWQPGVPTVPLNRLAVYYPETAAAGWLRLDQMYFEEPHS